MVIVRGGADGSSSSVTYPGVLLGGLPPISSFESDLPQLLAVVVGILGLSVLLAIPVMRATQRPTDETTTPGPDSTER